MKITNKLNLPEAIVDAVKNDGYTRGDADISVTGLLKPPRASALESKHWDDLEEDASDRIWSLMGQVVHGILERANKVGTAERRLFVDVLGWRVSGGMDLYEDHGTLLDYKVSTVYKFDGDGVPEQFEQQLNIYAEILRRNGHHVSRLQIVAILRDWSKMEARRNPDYPQTNVIVREVALWPAQKAWEFLEARVRMHQAARDALPECTPEDKWEKPTKWAVQKIGAARALKLHTTAESAETHLAELGTGYEINMRPGEQTRCMYYCSAAKFCTSFTGTGMFTRSKG